MPLHEPTASAVEQPGLVLGPMVRHTDRETAAIWVEVSGHAVVEVAAGEVVAEAATFRVHGHHFALVELSGLEPGSVTPYVVAVRAPGQETSTVVWPPVEVRVDDLVLPPPVISTLRPGKRPRLAFGSCRTSVPHDATGNDVHGVDAMRAYALAMARATTGGDQSVLDGEGRPQHMPWPDLLVLLGD